MFGYSSIGRNILFINKYFKLYFKKSLKKYNLNSAEGLALLIFYQSQLDKNEDIIKSAHLYNIGKTQEQIIDELHFDKGVMARTVKSLEEKGLVVRNENPSDNRSFIFTLTENAILLKPKIIDILRAWNNHLINGVEDEKLEIVRECLKNMSRNAMNSIKDFE